MYNITGKNNIRECYAKDKISGRNLYSLIECLKNIFIKFLFHFFLPALINLLSHLIQLYGY